MMSAPPGALVETRSPPVTRPVTAGARYRLAPGLELLERERGGILLSLKPLVIIRLNAMGWTLLRRLSATEACSVADLAAGVPGLSPLRAAAFLDDLSHRRLLSREPLPPREWPSVSVIVAARGRPSATRACVRSLLALNYARERLEIVVVDDASQPPLAEALEGLAVPVVRLDRNLGQSAARNLAANAVSGELLAFIDNDCEAAPDWLRALVPYFGDPQVVAVGGRVVAPAPDGPVAAFEAARSPLDKGPVEGPVGPAEPVAYLPTCNLVVRRRAWLAVGGFRAEMRVGEDVDLVWRLLGGGARVHYATGARVVHHHRVRLGALLARRADYGGSEADLQARHPEGRSTMHVPRAGLLVLTAVPAFWSIGTLGAVLPLAAVALAAAELVAKRRRLHALAVDVPARLLVASVIREHAASLYHLGHHATRYYGLPLVVAGLLWPPLLPVVALLVVVPPVADYRRLAPALPLPAFVALYWLEMAAYQVGVWRGCLAGRCWSPLLPRLRWRP